MYREMKQEIIEQVPTHLINNRDFWMVIAEAITPDDWRIVEVDGFVGWDVNHLNQCGFIVVTACKGDELGIIHTD